MINSHLKRLLDLIISTCGLLAIASLLIPLALIVWLQDFRSPFYLGRRVGKNFRVFSMVKLRSMIAAADKKGGSSTSSDDKRITWVGRLIRKFKIDEMTQLLNVFIGDMSLVGPRPQVEYDVSYLYTKAEKHLLSVRPGITDFSSITFSDEGDILKNFPDADLAYNQYIRPWKSAMGLLYIEHQSVWLDLKLIALTLVAIFNKPGARRRVVKLLQELGASDLIVKAAKREGELIVGVPPGADSIVTTYKIANAI
jgi:lipopolysaccharide/colanic/teichoic acid biosynthesis glycosyltransferase